MDTQIRFDAAAAKRAVLERTRNAPGDSPAARRLLCRACGQVITDEAQRIAVNGEHLHLRRNPAGIEYRFGCFQSAAGCSAVGSPTAEFTWFAGCRWRVAVCAGCGEHLGWQFSGSGHFFGLILSRLVEGSGKSS